jgi:hypothetical protein
MKAFLKFLIVILILSSCTSKQKKIELTENRDSLQSVGKYDIVRKFDERLKEFNDSFILGGKDINIQSDIGIKGKIKSLNESEYYVIETRRKFRKSSIKNKSYYVFTEIGNKLHQDCEFPDGRIDYKYDERNNLIEDVYYQFGKVGWIHRYKYDMNNHKTEETCWSPNNELLYINIYTYEKGGRLSEEIHHRLEDKYLDHRIIYRYDKNGNLIEEKKIDSFGEFDYKEYSIFNNDNKLLERGTYFSPDDTLAHHRWTYKYYQDGNLLEEIAKLGDRIDKSEYDSRGNLITSLVYSIDDTTKKREYLYKYNSENKLIEESFRYLESMYKNSWHKETYSYDSFGRLIKEDWFDSDDKFIGEILFSYDDRGDPLEARVFNSEGGILSKYTNIYTKFDSVGNWLSKTILINDNAESIFEREIEYY